MRIRLTKNSSVLLLVLLSAVVCITCSLFSAESIMHHHKQIKLHSNHLKDKSCKVGKDTSSSVPMPSLATGPLPYPTHSSIFSILSFGAKGNGISDDSKALLTTWKAACKVSGAILQIPKELKFLIKPVTLQGPCMPQLTFQIDGTLLAPSEVGARPKSWLFQWLNFKWLNNFTIQGSGSVDGQGSDWWSPSKAYHMLKECKHIPYMKPTALRFYASYNVTVRDINIINSPQCHLKFDSSEGIKVDNITISSPESSPNTDGIHLQNAKDVEIQHSNIGCGAWHHINKKCIALNWATVLNFLSIEPNGAWHVGYIHRKSNPVCVIQWKNKAIEWTKGDDCVSIQTGCSNIHVHHINCGPGHGISIGGLGKDKSVACVSNIIVEKTSLQSTLAGVRIKTWQGGIGSVKNVSFSHVQVSDVKYPIIIDQFYCDKGRCNNQTEAVAISGVNFDQITGTYLVQPIHLACSNDVPCIDVNLNDIQLKPSKEFIGSHSQQAFCWNSYGQSQSPLLPSNIDYCLRRNSEIVKRIARSHEHVC